MTKISPETYTVLLAQFYLRYNNDIQAAQLRLQEFLRQGNIKVA